MSLFNWGVKELKSETTTYGIICEHIITYLSDIKKDI
jgi:hypothetical protein